MSVVWFLGVILFLIIEAITVQFVCIWFAGGALGALLAATLGASSIIQVLVFSVISTLLLILSRPFVRKKLVLKTEATNADRLIGQTFSLAEEADNQKNTGFLIVNGVEWFVRAEDNQVIPKDTLVVVTKISGSKLIVKKHIS